MHNCSTFSDYSARLREFISRRSRSGRLARSPVDRETSEQFEDLALVLFKLQFENVPVYRRFCAARGVTPKNIAAWEDIPAIPTAAFKEYELSSLARSERTTVFHSSGTTAPKPSRHFHSHESLQLYEASLWPWFQEHVLPADKRWSFLILTPSPALAPRSSLVHMFETVRREFAPDDSLFVGRSDARGGWTLELDRACAWLSERAFRNQSVVILGTAFLFVALLDWMAEKRCRQKLAPGSRALETGGYKGRSRTLSKKELYQLITERLGIPTNHIVSEYGMSELSSQAYDKVAGTTDSPISNLKSPIHRRPFRFPPWARARIVSPETGMEAAEGETGLLQIYDLANVRSVMAIQTEDLGIRDSDGFELAGRALEAERRGCSLMSTHS